MGIATQTDQRARALIAVCLVHRFDILGSAPGFLEVFGVRLVMVDPVLTEIEHRVAMSEIDRTGPGLVLERIFAVRRADTRLGVAVHRRHHRRMHEMRVVAVHADEFPIAEVFGLVGATIGEDLAGGRRVYQQVEDRRRFAQIVFQRLALLGKTGEHEATV